MESDVIWLGYFADIPFPARLNGRVVRTVEQKGVSVRERFRFFFEEDIDESMFPEDYIGRDRVLVDVFTFRDLPGWDPSLIYQRLIPGSEDSGFDPTLFFAGNLEANGGGSITVDLREVPELPEDDFWALVAVLGGRCTSRSVQKLQRALAAGPESTILGFAKSLRLALDSLNSAETVESPDVAGPTFGTDGFLFWRLAIIARGRSEYERARSGLPIEMGEDEWAAGELLDGVASRAFEARTAVALDLIYEDGSSDDDHRPAQDNSPLNIPIVSEDGRFDFIRSLDGKGDKDVRPGPRGATEMFRRGLNPHAVGSRFLLRVDGGYSECVVLQRLDVRNENVRLHLQEGADSIAAQVGGVLVTPVEWYDTETPDPWSGVTQFAIRRRWKGDIDSYRTNYRLGPSR